MTVTLQENTLALKHRVLREVLRKYITLKEACSRDGNYSLEVCSITGCINPKTGACKGHEGPCIPVSINLLDLQGCLNRLSKRKKEAVFYNVILDMKQKDVAEVMGITTVSVGQYVEQACLQVAKDLWGEDE